MRRYDGVYRWFLFRAKPLRDESGTIIKWYGTNVDIEDRKQAEEQLRKSELNLREMTETIPEMLWSATSEGAIDYCNGRLLEYTGFSSDEVMGSGWTKLLHPDDVEQTAREWLSCVTTGAPYRVEVRTLHAADHTYRWCLTSALPLLDQQGRILKWHGTVVDMHDRKRAEADLRRANRYLTEAQRMSRTGSFTWDPARGERDWSEEMFRIWEFARGDELNFSELMKCVHPEDVPAVEAELARAIAIGDDYELFYRITTRSGALKHLHSVGQRLAEITDRNVYIGATQDITESRNAEEALKARKAELRRALAQLAEGQRLSKTGTFTADLQMDRHEWSEEYYRIFEIDPATPPSVGALRERVHADDLELFDAEIRRGMEGGGSDFIFRIVTPIGGLKYLRGVARLIEHVAGRPIFMGTVQDITERKRAEDELRRSEAGVAGNAKRAGPRDASDDDGRTRGLDRP